MSVIIEKQSHVVEPCHAFYKRECKMYSFICDFMIESYIVHMYTFYSKRLLKLIYLYLSTDCFMRISLQSTGPLTRSRVLN